MRTGGRIAAHRGKSIEDIANTPPAWRTPAEQFRLDWWAREAERFIAENEARRRGQLHGILIGYAVTAIVLCLGWFFR